MSTVDINPAPPSAPQGSDSPPKPIEALWAEAKAADREVTAADAEYNRLFEESKSTLQTAKDAQQATRVKAVAAWDKVNEVLLAEAINSPTGMGSLGKLIKGAKAGAAVLFVCLVFAGCRHEAPKQTDLATGARQTDQQLELVKISEQLRQVVVETQGLREDFRGSMASMRVALKTDATRAMLAELEAINEKLAPPAPCPCSAPVFIGPPLPPLPPPTLPPPPPLPPEELPGPVEEQAIQSKPAVKTSRKPCPEPHIVRYRGEPLLFPEQCQSCGQPAPEAEAVNRPPRRFQDPGELHPVAGTVRGVWHRTGRLFHAIFGPRTW